MANSWLRLWHDMPNDPKWRTIARISGEPIALVQALYMHLLVDASRNVTRGNATVTAEDLASALDVTESQIQSVLDAMEGRVLESMHLSGWEKRQPKREDEADEENGVKGNTQRQREWRERQKQKKDQAGDALETSGVTTNNALSQKITLDKDKDKEYSVTKVTAAAPPDFQLSEKSKTELWKSAVSLLGGQGVPESQARTLIGKLAKDYNATGEDIVLKAVEGAVLEQPADARAYLKATCQRLAGERKRDGSMDWTAEAI